MIKAHRIRIKANNKQRTYFAKGCGTSRFAYNWALEEWQKQYAAGGKPSEVKLRKQFNAIKKAEYPWVYDVTKVAVQQGIKNLGDAFKRFFNRESAYPKFKKKYHHDSFRADNGPAVKGADSVKIIGRKMQLPIIGWVKLTEKLRFKGQVKSVTISREANCWYASVSVDVPEEMPIISQNQGVVGVDLGITTLATCSNGDEYSSPKPYNFLLKRVQRFNKLVSRRKKGSSNRTKAKVKLAKLHAKIAAIRLDVLHKLTHKLATSFAGICIEDLNVKGMQKNRKLARHIMDCGFYEFKRQLKYKCEWFAKKLVIAERFFASSKLCNQCDTKNSALKLAERKWQCSNCLSWLQRDLNAALNLEKYMLRLGTESSSGC